MGMKPSKFDGENLLHWWWWIAPLIALLMFIWLQDMNATSPEDLKLSGVGFHFSTFLVSVLGGALFGVPATMVVRLAWFFFKE